LSYASSSAVSSGARSFCTQFAGATHTKLGRARRCLDRTQHGTHLRISAPRGCGGLGGVLSLGACGLSGACVRASDGTRFSSIRARAAGLPQTPRRKAPPRSERRQAFIDADRETSSAPRRQRSHLPVLASSTSLTTASVICSSRTTRGSGSRPWRRRRRWSASR
jgi:hypothetical protein